MGLIGSESDGLSSPYLIVGRDNDPKVVQIWDFITIFLAQGNPITSVTFTIDEDKFGQPIGHCFDLENKTLLPNPVKTFPYGTYASERKETTRALDTNSTCVDVKALEVELGVLQNLYAVSRDMLIGDGIDGKIKGFNQLVSPENVIDLQGDPLTKNDLVLAHNMITLGNGLCGYILGNSFALKAFMEAHFVEGIEPEFTHLNVCCPDGEFRKVQVPKFMGFPFLRIDTWPVTQCDLAPGSSMDAPKGKHVRAKRSDFQIKSGTKVLSAGRIAAALAQGDCLATDLVFIAAGQLGVSFHVPSNIGQNLFEVRETMIPGKSHVENTIYTTIALTVVSEGALSIIRNATVPGGPTMLQLADIAIARADAQNYSAVLVAVRTSDNKVFLRSFENGVATDLDNPGAWGAFQDFGNPGAGTGTIKEIGVSLARRTAGPLRYSVLITVRMSDGTVYLRSAENITATNLDNVASYGAYVSFGQP